MGKRIASAQCRSNCASPDLPAQIDAFPPLRPSEQTPRNSPITGVLLTNADLDHILGLFCLREGGQLNIHCTSAVRRILTSSLALPAILDEALASKVTAGPREEP